MASKCSKGHAIALKSKLACSKRLWREPDEVIALYRASAVAFKKPLQSRKQQRAWEPRSHPVIPQGWVNDGRV
jgi:hypothetical protein